MISASFDRRRSIALATMMAGVSRAGSFRSVRGFWLLLGGFFLFSISVNGVIAHLMPLLTDRGLSNSTAALGCQRAGRAYVDRPSAHRRPARSLPGTARRRHIFAIAALGVAALSEATSIPTAYAAAGLIRLGMPQVGPCSRPSYQNS